MTSKSVTRPSDKTVGSKMFYNLLNLDDCTILLALYLTEDLPVKGKPGLLSSAVQAAPPQEIFLEVCEDIFALCAVRRRLK